MLGSAGRTGSLEMSCGVSTWWEAEAQESVGICPQGGKVSVGGTGVKESPFFPSRCQRQAFSTFKPLQATACSAPISFMGLFFFFFLFRTRVQGIQTGPLVPVKPPQAELAHPSTRSLGMETQSLWGTEVGREGGSERQITSLRDTSNTLKAYRGWASGSKPDFTTTKQTATLRVKKVPLWNKRAL